MGHKVNPIGIRLGIAKDWNSKWYAGKKHFAEYLAADLKVREMLRKKLAQAGISKISIERPANNARVTIHTARPGVVIGRKGAAVKSLREGIERLTSKKVKLDINEITKPDLVSALVADNIAQQLERRIPHMRAMRKAAQATMQRGALGVKIEVAGRLNGSDMKRTDKVMEGRIPRSTLRADIDFARGEALTTFGQIGVKVWIYKGDVLPDLPREELSRPSRTQQAPAKEQR